MVKSLKFIVKTNVFLWFRMLQVRTLKVSKKHQKRDQNLSEILCKIDTTNMFENRKINFYFYYVYKLHNSYFVNFVYFVIYIYPSAYGKIPHVVAENDF